MFAMLWSFIIHQIINHYVKQTILNIDGWYKTAVTPLLTHWSYCSLALSHLYTLKMKGLYLFLGSPTDKGQEIIL